MLWRRLAWQTVVAAGAAAGLAAALSTTARSAPGHAADACGVPDTAPVWIDYGEGSVKPDTRAVLARPGVVVATSGTNVPTYFRAHGAATAYFALRLRALVGQPSAPADPATIPAAADALYAKASASTGCPTPWIGLNELFGSSLPTPWSATNAQYRANVLALMQGLAAHGARAALFVNGNPNVAADASDWWRQAAQAGSIVYEAYYDGTRLSSLGSLLGNRRIRLGMRAIIGLFQGIGVAPDRLGIALGFHSGRLAGAGGRQGLQPREAWLRVVKWEALGARQVAAETGISSLWSWGWGTFGAVSADPDKPAAACVYLWARDTSLCDGPATGGPAFNTSLVEGQIVLPPGVACTFAAGHVASASIAATEALTGDHHAAVDAAFASVALRTAAIVTNAKVLAVERRAINRSFGGSRAAYLDALGQAHATLGVARNVIRDELRRHALAAKLARTGSTQTTLGWTADREARAASTAICDHDDLPGSGDFPRSDAREVGVVPLPALLPFLFGDRTPPGAVAGLVATPGSGTVALSWADGREPDLAGYEVLRAATSGGPYAKLTATLLDRPAYVDTKAPAGAPSYYVVQAVDSSDNESLPSAEVSASPG